MGELRGTLFPLTRTLTKLQHEEFHSQSVFINSSVSFNIFGFGGGCFVLYFLTRNYPINVRFYLVLL